MHDGKGVRTLRGLAFSTKSRSRPCTARSAICQRAQPRIRDARASAAVAARRPRCGGGHARLRRRPRPAARHASPTISTTSCRGLVLDKGIGDAQPTTGFQRVIHRAVVHVQSSGREEVTGANVLVAIFAERESHAAFFLQEQDMTRFDAVQVHQPRHRQAGRHVRAARRARRRRGRGDGRGRRREEARRRTRSRPIASTSTRRPSAAASIR